MASRDRNLYVTSLQKGQFFFSVTGLVVLVALFLVEKLFCSFRLILQESSLTIERQNCCFVEKQFHLSNKSLRVFRWCNQEPFRPKRIRKFGSKFGSEHMPKNLT